MNSLIQLEPLSPLQWLNLAVVFVLLIPAPRLILTFKRTKILDFMLFGFWFISAFVTIFSVFLASIYPSLIFYQLSIGALNLAFYTLFLHAIRFKWQKPPKILLWSSSVWLISLTAIILNWTKWRQPNAAKVITVNLDPSYSSYFPDGAGYRLSNGTIIYSTAYRIIGDLFFVLVVGLTLAFYLRVTIIHETPRIITAYRLWIIVWIVSLAWTIFVLPWFNVLPQPFPNIFLLIGFAISGYIIVFYPEAMLISQVQISRVEKIYKTLSEETTNSMKDQSMDSNDAVLSYLKDLPKNIFDNKP